MVIELLQRRWWRYVDARQTRRELACLRSVRDPASRAIAGAITSAMAGTMSADERRWVDRIEQLRDSLSADTSELAITDYGAGKPGQDLTADEMRRGRVITKTVSQACKASKPPAWAFLLFRLIREVRPQCCLELGTCLGISTAYQGAALELNGGGRLVTLEGADSLAARARRNLTELGLGKVEIGVGRFEDTLGGVLAEVEDLDYAFIDGHHDEAATLRYFDDLSSHLKDSAVIIFDDISWSSGMKRAWGAIAADERIATAVDLGNVGICTFAVAPREKWTFRVGFRSRIR